MIDNPTVPSTTIPQPPAKQHLISRVLLKQFSTHGPNPQLRSFDLDHGKSKLRAPGAVGWRASFIEHEPEQVERVWQKTEDGLYRAFTAVVSGTILHDRASVDCLKRAIALHFLRRDVIKEIARATHARALEGIRAPHDFDGIPAVFEAVVRAQLDESRTADFASEMQQHFLKSGSTAARGFLEIYHSRDVPLVIGDSAVISFHGSQPGYVPFANAETHVLPIGRHHLIALGPADTMAELPPETAHYLNRLQIQSARRHVFFHPNDRMDAAILTARRARQ